MLDFLNYTFTSLSLSLAILVGLIILFQLLHYIMVYGRIIFNKNKKNDFEPDEEKVQGVSVVVVVNNNSKALQNELLKLLEQNHPLFEVVVVNENSTDDTEYVLTVLKHTYKNIKVINLGQNANRFSDRKFSVAIGIRSAQYDTVVLSDIIADVKDFDWLRSITQPMSNSRNKILIGYVALEQKKGLLNQFAQYYHATWSMNSLGYALFGYPFSSDGRNMAYSKEFFFQKGGLIAQYRDNCRQEDYFLSHFANKNNTVVNLNPKSFVSYPAYSNYRAFKRRAYAQYLSHRAFPFLTKLKLALLPISTLILYLTIAFMIFIGFPWQYLLLPILAKWVTQIIYYNKCMKRINSKIISLFAPIYEIYFIFFNFNLRVKKLFIRQKRHKIRWDRK
ncbi:MAG: glycosyltransferase [Bacteroidales bacterium]|nr:glycosyltransferase [bacterium]MBQ6754499.1 glycosyltransferase [Bacteroidales bacterium]